MSPAIPKQFESFAQKLSAQSRLIQPSDGWGLRLFWIGSSPERAAIIALGERDFDAALAKLFGMPQGSTTAPWAHGATASGFLARACLRASGIDFSEVDAWGGSASENCHSHSRRFNSARFFVVDPGQEAPAIQALTARLPGSWVY